MRIEVMAPAGPGLVYHDVRVKATFRKPPERETR